MTKVKFYLAIGLIGVLVLAGATAGVLARAAPGEAELARQAALGGVDPLIQADPLLAPDAPTNTLVQSYSAKYVCTRALPAGQPWMNTATPLVNQETDILIHNPNDFPVDVYIKATKPNGLPTDYKLHAFTEDQALKIDCTDIYDILGLTSPPAPGINLLGFVVIQIGPQVGPGGVTRYAPLDVTAEYVRSSEVLKKDIHFQPWWTWYPYGLPWTLGYPYERLVPMGIQPGGGQFDCAKNLAGALMEDVPISDPHAGEIVMALQAGYENYQDPSMRNGQYVPIPALVAMIGRCNKIMMNIGGTDQLFLDIDYVLLSNKSPHEYEGGNGTTNPGIFIPPPWNPGVWYDLPVVTQQNMSTDMDYFFRGWHTERWIEAGLPKIDVDYSMKYFFPYWCGWSYWSGWWNGGSCTDIGVGEGESLDVEQVTPVRVIMSYWPPSVP